MVAATTNGSEEGGSEAGGGGGPVGPVLLIRDAQIINDDEMFAADIWIENGIVKKISSQQLKAPEGAQVIEANGRWVLPAGIDVHTQFSANSSSADFSAGTKAALAGGTTTIIDTVYTRNESESLLAAFDRIRASIPGKAQCNVGLSVAVSQWKGEKTRLEMSQLVREKGVNSFILELSSDSEMFEALEHSKELGHTVKRLTQKHKGLSAAQIYVQARPAKLEAEQIHRVCVLSQLLNAPFSVLSATSSEASQALRNGRKEGALISAEVPVAAIFSGADSSSSNGPLTRIPLRPQLAHSEDALEMLANNPLCISAGIEERMSVLWEKAVVQLGKLDPMRFVAVTSSNPAKMFNVYPRKGRVAVGSDADLVLWDLDSIRATPMTTICAGQVLYTDGKFVGPSRTGQTSSKTGVAQDYFLPLEANSPYVFGMVQLREKTFNLSLQAVGRGKPEHEVDDSGESRRTSVASSVCSGIIDERPRPGSSSSTTTNLTKKPVDTNARGSTASGSRNRNIQSNDPPSVQPQK
uniref:Amidohydrolase-related domain-containing protein n=1 Tax=Ditylenchus dipsaci TaxID=166011 RepID=A0A915DYN5_9BILA